MPSPTKQTQTVRKRKTVTQGRWRKNRIKNQGSTLSRKELFAKK